MTRETETAMTTPETEETVELLPCPFCGGIGDMRHGGPGNWFVLCRTCGATSDDGSHSRAVERWNRRSPLTLTQQAD